MARMRPPAPTDTTDTLIGFTGFFGVVMLAVTMYCEISGRPALGWALVLLGLVVVVGVLVRRRAAIVRRAAGPEFAWEGRGDPGASARATRARTEPPTSIGHRDPVPDPSGPGND